MNVVVLDTTQLDTFRVKRNAIDYTGDDVDAASVDECIIAADNLLCHVAQWLTDNKPEQEPVGLRGS